MQYLTLGEILTWGAAWGLFALLYVLSVAPYDNECKEDSEIWNMARGEGLTPIQADRAVELRARGFERRTAIRKAVERGL